MSAPPLITVAIPTYNGSRFVSRAIRSVLSQDCSFFDLSIHDDRSDDDTIEVVRSLAGDRARVSVNGERLGLAGNWNRCVTSSRTPFVSVFHQDDVMSPGHLLAHETMLNAHPSLGFVCGAADVIDETGAPVPDSIIGREQIRTSDRIYGPGEFVPEMSAFNPIRCSTVTLSRPVHAEVGGFDPSYRYVVDWDFWIRAARRHSVAWLAKPTVAIRWHSSSETHRFKTGTADLDESVRLLDELDGYEEIDTKSSRPVADRRLARAFLNRAYDAARGGDRELMRVALGRALTLDRRILKRIAADPRLAARLAACWLFRGEKTGSHLVATRSEPR